MFYKKYFKSNYEELITYYPKYYREVREMRAILETEGKLADDMENNIERVFNNCFIDTADENTIGNLEKFLSLGLYKQRSLEERRRLVKSLFVGGGKISATMISEMIAAYTGAPVSCRFEPFDEHGNNKLYIDLGRGNEKTLYMSDILTLIERRIPAHIEYTVTVVYSFPIGAGKVRKHYKHDYEMCGTKPETALLAENHSLSTETVQNHTNSLNTYKASASEYNETGTIPDTAVFANLKAVDTAASGTFASVDVNYIPCGTAFTKS